MNKKFGIIFNSVFFIVFFICSSCQKDEIDLKRKENVFNGLTIKMPQGHSEKELSLSKDDYFKMIDIKGSHLKSTENSMVYSLDLLDSLTSLVLINYPRIDSIYEFDEIRTVFVELTDEQIIENKRTIDSFYNCLISYDLIKEINKSDVNEYLISQKKSKSKSYYFGYDLNLNEVLFLSLHARFVNPIKTATDLAFTYTDVYFPTMDRGQTVADAYRHAVWNAFICRESASKCEWVSECQKIAKEYSDAHESGATKPEWFTDEQWALDKSMDYHNNSVGRSYFGSIAYSYKKCWFCDRYVKSASVETVASGVYSYVSSAVYVTSKTEMDNNVSKLVYLK